jgi:hypothetical protein
MLPLSNALLIATPSFSFLAEELGVELAASHLRARRHVRAATRLLGCCA